MSDQNTKLLLLRYLVVKFTFHIRRQAGGIGVVIERGEKGLQVLRDHCIEHRVTGIPGCVGGNGWRHNSPHIQEGRDGSARNCPPNILLICSLYKQNVAPGMWWKHVRRTVLLLPPLYVVSAAVAK